MFMHCRKKDKRMKLNTKACFLTCLPLKLVQMERTELSKMLSQGRREIVGRGKTYFNVTADDMKLLKYIRDVRKLSYPKSVYQYQRHRHRHIPFVYDSSSYVYVLVRRKYIFTDSVNTTEYRRVCHEYSRQHIDKDVGDFVAFQGTVQINL